jgi:thiamine-phosphate pyrophosphorylase
VPVVPRLYAILDVNLLDAHRWGAVETLDAWLDAGIEWVQLRGKHLESGPMLALARELRRRTDRAHARLIINDRADVARLAGADGVHLGQDDLTPDDARLLLGAEAIVGLSTHSDEQASRALATSASYVAIGPVFTTRSKARPDPVVGLEGVSRAAAILRADGRPLIAIGGITLAQAPAVLAAGAASVAVISDLFGADPADRARAFVAAVRAEPV